MCNTCGDVTKQHEFFNLHVHSNYSVDGISSPSKLIASAISKGQRAMAITDHGELGGVVDFWQSSKQVNDFKAIAGCEFYLDYGDDRPTHLTVLADGVKGYNNLVRVLNNGVIRASKAGKKFRTHPIKIDDLVKYNEGLIILTGCPKSAFQYQISSDVEAIKELNLLKSVYGDRIFAEIMLNSDDESLIGQATSRALLLSEMCGVDIVLTNDVHFSDKFEQPAHNFHVANVMGFTYNDDDLFLKSTNDMLYTINNSNHTAREMAKFIEGLDNTKKIIDRISGVSFSGTPQLPFIEESSDKFKSAIWAGYESFCSNKGVTEDQEMKDRLEYEIKIIQDKGFDTYFLLTQEMIQHAKNGGHKSGVGRGSGAGSAVSYMLGITAVNPLDYNLYFERFLNPYRTSMPDIDNDFSQSGRESIIEYMGKKYNAVPIATNTYYGHKILIRDIARILRLSNDMMNALLDDENKETDIWTKVQTLHPTFNIIYDTLLETGIRHGGKHAGGILILPEDIEYEIPLTNTKDGMIVSSLSEGGHGSDLSASGGIKFDVLGVTTLDMLQEIEEVTGVFPPELKPFEYNDCFDLIEAGNVSGVFQLSGNTARRYGMEYKPKSIHDISFVTALARSGAIESGASEAFLKYRVNDPMVKSIPPLDSGNMIDFVYNGKTYTYYDHWMINTNLGFIRFSDLENVKDEITKIITFM